MKKTLIILTAILMLCIFGTAAAEEEQSIIGKPFPDFQTMDTEQNAFSLSEALKDHEAVLINLWASWCGPCVHEFPYLNEAYNKYKDKVAFIGLTVEPEDTLDILRDIKKENSLEYPVAPEAGTNILQHLGGGEGIPTTIIVDRFGNAVYMQVMAFRDSTEIGRLLDSFLGEQCGWKTKMPGGLPSGPAVRILNMMPRLAKNHTQGILCPVTQPGLLWRSRLRMT